MRKIYKYPIFIQTAPTVIAVPKLTYALHVGLDGNGVACIWCSVPMEVNDMTTMQVFVVPTGQCEPEHVEPRPEYVGTIHQGPFIWHIFVL